MDKKNKLFRGWPGTGHVLYALWLQLLVTVLFVFFYGGTNLIASLHTYRIRFDASFEARIPLLPWTCLIYLSLFPMFWLSPFLLRSREELESLARKVALCTLGAAPFFLLLPGDVVFPSGEAALGSWAPLYFFTKDLSLEHNLFPSLHVAFALCCAHAYSKGTGRFRRVALGVWAFAVCLSTLFAHRHHVVDLVGGGLLAMFVIYKEKEASLLGTPLLKAFVKVR